MPFATRARRPSCRPGCAPTLVDPLSRTWVASATAGGRSEPPGRPIGYQAAPADGAPLHAYATGALPRSPPAWGLTGRVGTPPARTATRPRKPGTRRSGPRDPYPPGVPGDSGRSPAPGGSVPRVGGAVAFRHCAAPGITRRACQAGPGDAMFVSPVSPVERRGVSAHTSARRAPARARINLGGAGQGRCNVTTS